MKGSRKTMAAAAGHWTWVCDSPAPSREGAGHAGAMFWLSRKKLPGSYRCFTWTSRS